MKKKEALRLTPVLSVMIVLFVFGAVTLVGADVKITPFGEITFKNDLEFPQRPWSFCVTEDELLIVPDSELGEIKILDRSERKNIWNVVHTFGEKGFGENQLMKPTFSSYNSSNQRLALMDFEKRRIYIYSRRSRGEFEKENEFLCYRLGFDIHLAEGKLFVSGYKEDLSKTGYHLYSVDLKTEEVDYIIPSFLKYGYGSNRVFKEQNSRQKLGRNAWVTTSSGELFFAWEADLKIWRTKTNKSFRGSDFRKSFGKITDAYKKPYLPDDRRNFYKLKEKMSYVVGVFSDSDNVYVLYRGFDTKDSSKYRLQVYSLDGRYKGETYIPKVDSPRLWSFEKNSGTLYSLYVPALGQRGGKPFVSKYKIEVSN